MPGEAVKSAAPLSEANAQNTPKKKASTSGKAALAKVTLLDGSVLDVTIDVSVGFAWILRDFRDELISDWFAIAA